MRGHIRERSPGHWTIVIDVQEGGERKRRWHSFTGTKRQAQDECARLITAQQNGSAITPSKITVAAFIERFERDWVAANVTLNSGERYKVALAHVRKHLGDKLLQKLRPEDLAAFYATLKREGLQPRTVKFVGVVLHRCLGQAKKWTTLPRLRSRPRLRSMKPSCFSPRKQRPYCNGCKGSPSICSHRSPWPLARAGMSFWGYAGRMSISTMRD